MKRINQTAYISDAGTELVKLKDNGQAYVAVCHAGPDLLDELATACSAAAEELRSLDQHAANIEHANVAS